MTDIKPVALASSSVAAFTEAVRGPKGTLDAWLEDNNEAEVRAHVEAYAEQAIDSLRSEMGIGMDEVAVLRGLLDEVRSHFTRDDDLPDDLLPRIDATLAGQQGGAK